MTLGSKLFNYVSFRKSHFELVVLFLPSTNVVLSLRQNFSQLNLSENYLETLCIAVEKNKPEADISTNFHTGDRSTVDILV